METLKKYQVKDSLGNTIRVFNTYKEALNYKQIFGNYGWYIW